MKLNIIETPETFENTTGLPAHLGGHENETHIDEGALEYLVNKFKAESFLDIGCGPGGMVELARNKFDMHAIGIDGDYTIDRSNPEYYIVHDYTSGPVFDDRHERIFDVAWSCEFLEHVEERFMDNYMQSFLKAKYIVITHALPGQGGHWHVNEQDNGYWINNFGIRGFLLDVKSTIEIRQASTMKQHFLRRTGMVFWNGNLNWTVNF